MIAPHGTQVETRPAAPVRRDLAVERRGWWVPLVLGPGRILGLLGAGGVIASLFLSWHDPGVHPDRIPVAYLWDRTTTSTDPSLLIALVPIAVIVALGAFVPFGGLMRFIGGLGMLLVVGAFAYQLHQSGLNLGDVLDTGFYIGAVGGFLAFLSGCLPSSMVARRPVIRADAL